MSQLNANDISDKPLTDYERHVLTRYGSLPNKNNLLRAQRKEPTFFDSGDFAVSKATDDSVTGHQKTGKEHPNPENISHLSSPVSSDSNLKIDANASQYRSTTTLVEVSSPLTGQHSQREEIGTPKSTPLLRR